MKPPYYESRFIRANHPSRAQALWLRETLLLTGDGARSADVWVMLFDPDGAGNAALKQPHPVDDAEFRGDPWTVRIGETQLDERRARGTLPGASWELDIAGDGGQVKLLADFQYASWFPSAKTVVRLPQARFDGRITFGDTTFEVDGWPGSVNHNWGRHHTPAYAFGQVCGFDNAPESTLEIVTARSGVGPMLLPPLTLMVFRHEGREFAVRSVVAARRTRGEYRPFEWSFSCRFDDCELTGRIVAEPREVIGLTYTDTSGTAKYCYNSAVATCRIALSGSGFGDVELVASRRAMFEILTDSSHPDVPLMA